MVDVGMRTHGTSPVDDMVICVRCVATILETISDALIHRLAGMLYLNHD
jgi:hypothetical protein